MTYGGFGSFNNGLGVAGKGIYGNGISSAIAQQQSPAMANLAANGAYAPLYNQMAGLGQYGQQQQQAPQYNPNYMPQYQNQNLTGNSTSYQDAAPRQGGGDLQGTYVASYSAVQNSAVPYGSQYIFMNMNEDEFYIKTKGDNGKDVIKTFTFIEKEKPQELLDRDKDKQMVDLLSIQMKEIQRKLDSLLSSIPKSMMTEMHATVDPTEGIKEIKTSEKPIYNGGK